jgi:REP element-mobilizing transposase RayT
VDRYWLLTWTMYGNWLPGDSRGFVSSVNDGKGRKVTHNIPGTPFDEDWELLNGSMLRSLKQPPIRLNLDQANVVEQQFHETACYRGWQLIAAAIMANHCHIVIGVPGDPNPSDLLRDFKAYASRSLNRRWSKPLCGTWWTESGSKRKLKAESAILSAVAYVRDQEYPLVLWIETPFGQELGSGPAPGKLTRKNKVDGP